MTGISLKQAKILDVTVNSTSYEQVLSYVQNLLRKEEKFYIVTPNPEQVMLAQDDEYFKNILNNADISIPDGIGLVAASMYDNLPRPTRVVRRLITLLKQGIEVGFAVMFDQKRLQRDLKLIKGRKVFEDLIILCNDKSLCVCLVGDDKKSAQKAAAKLRQKYPNLHIHAVTGPALDSNGAPKKKGEVEEESVVKTINGINPDLLFIGYGAPKQEKWLYRLFDNLNFKCAMVVGGTFDYICGTRSLVPKWVEDFNFEWLYRLLTGSQKPARIFAAFPQFAFRVFLNKMVNK